MSEAMLDRLALSEKRVQDMAEGIRQVQALPDPVGEIVEGSVRPNGCLLYTSRCSATCATPGRK